VYPWLTSVFSGINYEFIPINANEIVLYMKNNATLAKDLISYLKGSHAHVSLDDALKGLPADLRGVVPPGLPYSIWQLLDHIRIAQWDMVAFSSDPKHQSPPWPKGYWAKEAAPASEKVWTECLKKIKEDEEKLVGLLEDPDVDLFAPFPYGDGQHLFKEVLQVIDHNSYHTAEIVAARRILGVWK
jgi:hypothetical protein